MKAIEILHTHNPISANPAPIGSWYIIDRMQAAQADICPMEAILYAAGWLPDKRAIQAYQKISLFNAPITTSH